MINRFFSHIRQPVKREGAERYLLFTLLSFAASVSLTRLFLWATGFPQVGGGELHIAHVLWGGLLLFIAALVPLILANRWAYTLSAILTGAGVGLFIDEVGKFITRSNDYFYPAAAPIIYVFFLLTVLLYLEVRRPPSMDARTELYCVFDDLQEVIDRDLDPQERADMEERLRDIAGQAESPDLARLANELLHFLMADSLYLVPRVPSMWERWMGRLWALQTRWVKQRRLKAVLGGGLAALGTLAFVDLARLLWAVRSPELLHRVLANLIAESRIASASGLSWFYANVALQGVVGLLLLIAAGLLVTGQERQGIRLGYLGLLLSLTAVDLLMFYFDQFSAILPALIQFGLLLGILFYRRRYLTMHEESRQALAKVPAHYEANSDSPSQE
jgi:hypothetical protein